MILYRLRCSRGHEFESWFKDSKAYERQERRALVPCPTCDDTKIERAPMAPRIGKGERRADAPAAAETGTPVSTPAPTLADPTMAAMARHMPKELREALLRVREQVERNCDYVGDNFAEEARKIHYGESDRRGIYGETTDAEAEALAEEGIEFGRLPWVPRGN